MVYTLISFQWNHLLGSFVYCVRKLLRTCAYQEVRNVSFPENFAQVLRELFFRNILKFTFVLLFLKFVILKIPFPFLKIEKKILILGKNVLIVIISGLNFPIKMLF